MNDFLDLACEAVEIAGREVLSLWNTHCTVDIKNDGSPVTLADRRAHAVIVRVLSSSGLPIVSEEADSLHIAARDYWLVDPLDGTKEFIAGNPEFTVNVARIVDGFPLLGVVAAPALGETFFGVAGVGSRRIDSSGAHDLTVIDRAPECRIAVSRFHDHPDTEAFIAQHSIARRIVIGSALKYGRLAAASVDVFPRFAGSSEWDTAAGQAVLEAVGGTVLDCWTGRRLTYGKPNRRNPPLLSFRAPYCLKEFALASNRSNQ